MIFIDRFLIDRISMIFILFLFFLNFNLFAENVDNSSVGQRVLNFFYDENYKNDKNFKRHRLEFETGVLEVLYNKIGKNNSTGTLFNTSSIDNNLNFYFRISYYFNLDKKNSFRVLIAPLKYSGTGNLDSSFTVDNQNFSNGMASYNYQFNSYRLTYRREVFSNNYLTFRIGLTLKIRDAKFNLNQGSSNFEQSNVGFVPLGHINLELNPTEKFHIVFEGDLAAAPQGRAFDIATSVKYDISDNIDFSLGYRFLEGGAFNSNAFNKAFFNYYFASVGIKI